MKTEKNTAAMPTDLKLKNRIKILNIFRISDAVSINDLTQMTGISRQTIVKSVNYFLEKNIITSLGKGSSTEIGGKKPEIFKFNSQYKYLICVRFEDESVITAIMDLKLNIIATSEFPIEKNESIERIVLKFKAVYDSLTAENNISSESIYGAGICVSGICSQKTGIMRYNSLFPSWGQDIPIVEKFKNVLPESVEVCVYNDSKATGFAELVKNPELAESRFLTVYTYSGISASIIENSSIQEGHNSLLGEVGHICVDAQSSEVCECGMNGCLEKKLSKEAIRRVVYENKDIFEDSMLSEGGEDEKTDLQYIFECADKGDRLAQRVCEYCAEYFSVGLRNIILSTDPDNIIIQGKYSYKCDYFRKAMLSSLLKFKYFPSSSDMYNIEFDDTPLWQLALIGIGEIMARKLFENDELYR